MKGIKRMGIEMPLQIQEPIDHPLSPLDVNLFRVFGKIEVS